MRARHVTYYTISDSKSSLGGLNARPSAQIITQVLAGDRTLGLPRVKRTICQLSYENTARIELATSTLLVLRYATKLSEHVRSGGIEPPPTAWKAAMIPFHHERSKKKSESKSAQEYESCAQPTELTWPAGCGDRSRDLRVVHTTLQSDALPTELFPPKE